MSSKNPLSFAFSVLFEIAAVVAIVSILPRINLRPSASASQSPAQMMPIQTTDLRIPASRPWTDINRTNDQSSVQIAPPVIEATPASPHYVEQQLDRASQRLLNSVGGAVNQASQEWLRPLPPSDSGMSVAPSAPTAGTFPTTTTTGNDVPVPPPTKQTAQKPARWKSATQRPTSEPRPWLRY